MIRIRHGFQDVDAARQGRDDRSAVRHDLPPLTIVSAQVVLCVRAQRSSPLRSLLFDARTLAWLQQRWRAAQAHLARRDAHQR
jgi:hypothetical protein